MPLAILMFLIGAGGVLGAYAAVTHVPGILARRRLDQRLSDMSTPIGAIDDESSVVKEKDEGPLPGVDRLVARTGAGVGLKNFLFIIWGTGVGGGIVIDGKIYRGPFGGAGEIGHQLVPDVVTDIARRRRADARGDQGPAQRLDA